MTDRDCQNIINDISLLDTQFNEMFKSQGFNPLEVMTKKEKEEQDKQNIC